MRSLRLIAAIVVLAASLPTNAYAQFVGIGAHTRLSDMANAEANGGLGSSLIGLNAAGINNWGINQWDLSSIQGDTVTEVTITFVVNRGFTNANHGSALDTISLHEMYSTNAGWLEGTQSILATNVEINGAATFNFQAQTSETEGTPWRDETGADVADLTGAFNPVAIDSVAGYAQGDGPEFVEFTIPIALAQTWVDDPASFAGLVLVSNDDGDSLSRFNFTADPALLSINPTDVLLGDVNLDGEVDFADISQFISVLSDGGDQAEADVNEDGLVDFADIGPFIGLLSGA